MHRVLVQKKKKFNEGCQGSSFAIHTHTFTYTHVHTCPHIQTYKNTGTNTNTPKYWARSFILLFC